MQHQGGLTGALLCVDPSVRVGPTELVNTRSVDRKVSPFDCYFPPLSCHTHLLIWSVFFIRFSRRSTTFPCSISEVRWRPSFLMAVSTKYLSLSECDLGLCMWWWSGRGGSVSLGSIRSITTPASDLEKLPMLR